MEVRLSLVLIDIMLNDVSDLTERIPKHIILLKMLRFLVEKR
jgi:hypothetical protein